MITLVLDLLAAKSGDVDARAGAHSDVVFFEFFRRAVGEYSHDLTFEIGFEGLCCHTPPRKNGHSRHQEQEFFEHGFNELSE